MSEVISVAVVKASTPVMWASTDLILCYSVTKKVEQLSSGQPTVDRGSVVEKRFR